MTVGRKWKGALFAGILTLFLCVSADAAERPAFSPALSEAEGRAGDSLEISIPYDGSLGEVGAFLVRVEFDPQVFEYRRVRESPDLRDAYVVTLPREDWIGSGYVQKETESCLALPGETFTYFFRVREDAPEGDTRIEVSVYQAADPDSNPLTGADVSLSYTVLPPPSGEASLVSLVPKTGELEPAFAPDWFDYRLTVPFEVTSVSFLAEPAEEGLCRVNRKNLGAGGSDTEFLFTVTAADGVTKTVYRVTVHREEKTASPKPSGTPRPTAGTGSSAASGNDAGLEAQGSQSGTAAKLPSVTERPRKAKASPSPSPAAGKTSQKPGAPPPAANQAAAPAYQKKSGGTVTGPSVVINNGDSSLLPLILSCLILISAFFLSKPLAKWLCERFYAREHGDKAPGKKPPGPEE